MHLQWAWHVLVLKILFRIQQPFTLLLCLGANMLANLWGFVQNIIWFSQAAHVTGHLESFIHLRKVTTRFWRKRWIGRMEKKQTGSDHHVLVEMASQEKEQTGSDYLVFGGNGGSVKKEKNKQWPPSSGENGRSGERNKRQVTDCSGNQVLLHLLHSTLHHCRLLGFFLAQPSDLLFQSYYPETISNYTDTAIQTLWQTIFPALLPWNKLQLPWHINTDLLF